jgi:hypothetical protein
VEEVVDLLEQAVGVRADAVDVAALGRPAVGRGDESSGKPQDDRQRRLELVPGVGHDLAAARVGLAHALREAGFGALLVVGGTGVVGVHQGRHGRSSVARRCGKVRLPKYVGSTT